MCIPNSYPGDFLCEPLWVPQTVLVGNRGLTGGLTVGSLKAGITGCNLCFAPVVTRRVCFSKAVFVSGVLRGFVIFFRMCLIFNKLSGMKKIKTFVFYTKFCLFCRNIGINL